MDRDTTGKAFVLLLDLRYPNHKPDGFPTTNSHGLVGSIDWGESLTIDACEFPGLNITKDNAKVDWTPLPNICL